MTQEWRSPETMNAMGGTELMMIGLENHIDKEYLSKFQIIPSRLQKLDKDRHRIYWCHDLPQDPAVEHLGKNGWEKFNRVVFVSHWQRQLYLSHFGIPWHKTAVLHNAIDIDYNKEKKSKPKDVINVVYHTTPHRGLEILVPVFEKLLESNEDIHLHVYSSFNVYGWGSRDEPYKELFDKIKNNSKMTYYGAVSNQEIRTILDDMHIFAYPSIWPETSCIALIEAMTAGCICVHPDFAALPETACNWNLMYPWHENPNSHAQIFLKNLQHAINTCRKVSDNVSLQNQLEAQIKYMNLFYSWELRKEDWKALLREVESEPKDLITSPSFMYKT